MSLLILTKRMIEGGKSIWEILFYFEVAFVVYLKFYFAAEILVLLDSLIGSA